MRSMLAFVSGSLTILALAKLSGQDVETDPRSADFAKIRIGNTRIDIFGGFQQYVRMIAQVITGEMVSSTSGRVMTLGEGYKPTTRYDVLMRFIEGKLQPTLSFLVSKMKGRTFTGEEFSAPKEIGLRSVPMVVQDIYDLAKEDPKLLPLIILPILGVGMQTYKPSSVRKQMKAEAWRKLPVHERRAIERQDLFKVRRNALARRMRQLAADGRDREAKSVELKINRLVRNYDARVRKATIKRRPLQQFLQK